MPADPNAPVPTDAPIYASPPDLRVSTADGFTHSPKHPNEKIWLSESMQADEAGNHALFQRVLAQDCVHGTFAKQSYGDRQPARLEQ